MMQIDGIYISAWDNCRYYKTSNGNVYPFWGTHPVADEENYKINGFPESIISCGNLPPDARCIWSREESMSAARLNRDASD